MSDAAHDLFAAIHANNLEGVELLLSAEPELWQTRSPSGLSPLMFATYYRRPAIVEALLALGQPLTLSEAAATGQATRVQELLEQDPAQVDTLSPDGFTPLGLAAFFGQKEVARQLLAAGADLHAYSQNAMQVQPLHSALAGNHTEVARLLIEAGADVNAAQQAGFTPLMSAAQYGNTELVRLLLARGADAQAQTHDGRDALSLAEDDHHEDVLTLLREASNRA